MTEVLATPVVIAAAFAYLAALFAVAAWADRRARAGRSVIGNAWVYALSMGVYCSAWTYFGSVGRAASGGLWFLPIYLGPTLAMVGDNVGASRDPEVIAPLSKLAGMLGGGGQMVHVQVLIEDQVLFDAVRKGITNRGGLQSALG